MEPGAIAEWVLKRACRPCRKNDSYHHKACIEAKDIHDVLKSAIRVNETTTNGGQIKGWLIPD
jgi:hypothetical protein